MRIQRVNLIQDYIQEHQSVSLDNLCEVFHVSKNTVRRDINALVEKGLIKKVYGGVTALTPPPSSQKVLPYEERDIKFSQEKDTLCRLAAQFIADGDIIYIDTGTTCRNIIDYITDKECTIITNSLLVATKAIPYPNLNIISLPGKLKRETLSFVGTDCLDFLKRYNIGKAFLACSGVTMENGLTNSTTEEYIIKKEVIENSRANYLMADHSKFGIVSLMTFAKLNQIKSIITDQELPEAYQEYCAEHNIDLIIS